MAAVRLFPQDHVERELWRRQCRKRKDYAATSLWCTKDGHYNFTVPFEGPDHQCNEYSLREILAGIDAYLAKQKK
jgi:hypothetical protein